MAEATTAAELKMAQVRIGKVHEVSKEGNLAWVRIPSGGGDARTVIIRHDTGKEVFTCHGSRTTGSFGEKAATAFPPEGAEVALAMDQENPSLVLKWAPFSGYPKAAKAHQPTVPTDNHIPGMVRPGPHRQQPRSSTPLRR